MSAPKVDQQWIDEQMAHFPAGSMDTAVQMLRAFERADRMRQTTSSENVGGKAA